MVGIEGEPANYEMVEESSFSDPTSVMLCDDDVVSKGLQPTCFTKKGDVVCGQVLILATNNFPQDLCLLNLTQTKIVKEELKLHPKPPNPEDDLVLRCGILIKFYPHLNLCNFTF